MTDTQTTTDVVSGKWAREASRAMSALADDLSPRSRPVIQSPYASEAPLAEVIPLTRQRGLW